MKNGNLRTTLLATSSALALLVAVNQQSAQAATCTVVTNPAGGLPYTQNGNTCVNFTTSPAGSGSVLSTGTVSATGTTTFKSTTGITVFIGVSLNGGITNQGTINSNAHGSGIIVDQGTVGGSIVNATGATLNVGQGINVEGNSVAGSIINNGTITASSNAGIGFGNGMMGGGVTNTGTITSGLAPIVVSNATLGGSVVNTGKLVAVNGSVAIAVNNGGSVACKRRSNNPSLKRPGLPVAPE